MIQCKNCGNTINKNSKFCPNCGTENEEYVEKEKTEQKIKTLITKKNLIIIGVILIAIIAIIITIVVISNAKKDSKDDKDKAISFRRVYNAVRR